MKKGSSHLLRTEDAGNNWAFTMLSYNFLNVCFVNNYLGFAGGGYVRFYHDTYYFGDIFKTQDGEKHGTSV